VSEPSTFRVDAPSAPEPSSKRRRWLDRSSIRRLRHDAIQPRRFHEPWDERENERTRLPATEQVHLAGLTLVDVFTPSTVSHLYETLKDLPTLRPARRQEWLDAVAHSRGTLVGGHISLGITRPPGPSFGMEGFVDPGLPNGVEAVALGIEFVAPSITAIVANFTISEAAGDLSPLLRADYQTERGSPDISVHGQLGGLRARVPWSRPKQYQLSQNVHGVEELKRSACQRTIDEFETRCCDWLAERFRGRFTTESLDRRPTLIHLLTVEQRPFEDRPIPLEPLELDFAPVVWRSAESLGWALTFPETRRNSMWSPRNRITASARRSDLPARVPGAGVDPLSNWDAIAEFDDCHERLVAVWGVSCLLSLYATELAILRDQAGAPRRFSRPVRQAREFDLYLLADGLDASALTADVLALTEDLERFRWRMPEYTEDLDVLPEQVAAQREPDELVPALREHLRGQCTRLSEDTRTTTENLRASAQLRQAIANTRLQRTLLLLSGLATTIAIVTLLASKV